MVIWSTPTTPKWRCLWHTFQNCCFWALLGLLSDQISPKRLMLGKMSFYIRNDFFLPNNKTLYREVINCIFGDQICHFITHCPNILGFGAFFESTYLLNESCWGKSLFIFGNTFSLRTIMKIDMKPLFAFFGPKYATLHDIADTFWRFGPSLRVNMSKTSRLGANVVLYSEILLYSQQ